MIIQKFIFKLMELKVEKLYDEAAFVGAVNVLGGRLRYNPPAGKGEYDYDTYGNPPGWQYYLLGSDKEEWLMNPESELRPDQMEQVEEEVLE